MRTALWETSPGALAALLNAGGPLNKADLYTLTLVNGAVYRWSGSDLVLTGGGNTWGLGPGLERTKVKFTVGISVDSMTVTLTDIAGTTINGQALIPFIRAGGLYGARLQVDKAFWGPADTAPVGALLWFPGRVADMVCDRYSAQLTIKSDLELLDVMVPLEVYQQGCLNTLYDPRCGLARATYSIPGAATAASDSRRITINIGLLGGYTGYFDLGVITFTSGANAGISRTVKTHVGGSSGGITVLQPWPFAWAAGDTFTAYPGCDKTQATCTAKFNNLPHFRGQPYIPVPETVT